MLTADRRAALLTPLVSSQAPITTAFPPLPRGEELPRGATARALELNSHFTTVSPHQRTLMRHLLLLTSSSKQGSRLEQELYVEHQRFSDYAYAGGRLLTLLSGAGIVSQFALTLRVNTVVSATASEAELFPELFANERLTTEQYQQLSTQLDIEYDQTIGMYTRLVLASVLPEELLEYPRNTSVTVTVCRDNDNSHCRDLLSFAKELAREQIGDEALRLKYGAFAAMILPSSRAFTG